MPKEMDRAAEIVTSLTIDLSRALDMLEDEKQLCGFLKRRNAQHIFDNEELHSEIRNLRAKLRRAEKTERDLRKCLEMDN